MDFNHLLADRTGRMGLNVIREILKVVSQPGMVSLAGGIPEKHLPKIIELYRPKQEAMLSALDNYFPEGFKWSRPEGGMFLWVEGPEGFDMDEMYWKAVKRNVAFVPGKYFFTSRDEGIETMRLNYTMTDEKTIDRAVKILSEVIKKQL